MKMNEIGPGGDPPWIHQCIEKAANEVKKWLGMLLGVSCMLMSMVQK